MSLSPAARALVRLGVVLLIVAACAGVWEILASQSPTSPYHVGVLPGPVAQLRGASTVLALCTFAGAWLMPWLAQPREPWLLVGMLYAGAVVTVAAFVYGATTGMYGVQIDDPRPDSQLLFLARATGYGILALCLLDVARRVLLRRPPAA